MQREWAAKVFGDREDPRVRLRSLFGGELPNGGQPPQASLEWAQGIVGRDGGFDEDVVKVTRILRRAERRLTLESAAFLARHVVEPA